MPGKKKIAAAAIFVLLIFILHATAPALRNGFFAVTSPIQRILWKAGSGTSQFLYGIIGRNFLVQENSELKAQIASLLHSTYELEQLRLENENLQKAFVQGKTHGWRFLPVRPIGRELSRDVFILDQGSDAGIKPGMAVVTASQESVGVIQEAGPSFSKVRLISDKGFVTDVVLLGRDVTAVVRGEGNFKLTLDLVPRDKKLESGDSVFTSHLGSVLPPDLLVGRIENPQSSDTESFQRAVVIPFFDASQISTLFVLLNTL
jgi:rod shape-determining protein MreC